MEVSRISDLNEISFPKLGWTFHIDPTAFTVFGVSIQWYEGYGPCGIAVIVETLTDNRNRTAGDIRHYFDKFGLDLDRAADPIIGGIIGGIIGARIYYVIWKWDEYKWDWKAMINTRNGGLAIYGGIIGALVEYTTATRTESTGGLFSPSTSQCRCCTYRRLSEYC